MNRKIILIGIAILLVCFGFSGCFEINQSENEGGNSKDTSDKDYWNDTEDVEDIIISGMGSIQTVNKPNEKIRLIVTGMNSDTTVTKETILTEVILSGMNAIVRVSRIHSFSSTVSGLGAEIVLYD